MQQDLDLIFEWFGQFGLWQRFILGLVSLLAIGDALITFEYKVVGYVPQRFR